jgi:hypothetical protein
MRAALLLVCGLVLWGGGLCDDLDVNAPPYREPPYRESSTSTERCYGRAEDECFLDIGDSDAGTIENCISHCTALHGDDLAAVQTLPNSNSNFCCCSQQMDCTCQGGFPQITMTSTLVKRRDNPIPPCPEPLVRNTDLPACRKFDHFDAFKLKACQRHLSNTTTYHLLDTTYFDMDMQGISIIDTLSQQVASVMDQSCTSNVVAMICHATFRECKEVEDLTAGGGTVWLPALQCRSECERRLGIWDQCVSEIGTDSEGKARFEQAMQNLVEAVATIFVHSAMPWFVQRDALFPSGTSWSSFRPQQCDVNGGINEDIANEDRPSALILGRMYVHSAGVDPVENGLDFPYGMSRDSLYPVEASVFSHVDGNEYDVPCFVPGNKDAIVDLEPCPHPYVRPVGGVCSDPCPSNAYSMSEWNAMWLHASIPSTVGLLLNLFLALTWCMGGVKHRKHIQFQLKVCVALAIVYGIVDTAPVLFLKFNLACECSTSECVGTSLACAINRSSIFILLGIMVNLCGLTYALYATLDDAGGRPHFKRAAVDKACLVVPVVFVVLGYAFDTDDPEAENHFLNNVRHGFNCSMRFSNMAQEWVLLWFPFLCSGTLTLLWSCLSWCRVDTIQVGWCSTVRGGEYTHVVC